MSAPEVVHTCSISVNVLVMEYSKSSQRTIFVKKMEHNLCEQLRYSCCYAL